MKSYFSSCQEIKLISPVNSSTGHQTITELQELVKIQNIKEGVLVKGLHDARTVAFADVSAAKQPEFTSSLSLAKTKFPVSDYSRLQQLMQSGRVMGDILQAPVLYTGPVRSLSSLSNSFCAAVPDSKSCQSYNEIMGNGPPARVQKWLRSGRETGNLFGVALPMTAKFAELAWDHDVSCSPDPFRCALKRIDKHA